MTSLKRGRAGTRLVIQPPVGKRARKSAPWPRFTKSPSPRTRLDLSRDYWGVGD
jgi:hypothetical protein